MGYARAYSYDMIAYLYECTYLYFRGVLVRLFLEFELYREFGWRVFSYFRIFQELALSDN